MVNYSFIFFLLRRYLRFDKTQPFITISAILAFLGVGIGVMVLIVAMAIMNGFDKEFERKLFVMNYPITLYPKTPYRIDDLLVERLKERFPHMRFSPYLTSQAIAKKNSTMQGGVVFGVDFKRESAINPIVAEALPRQLPEGDFVLLSGSGLSEQLYVSEGDKLLLIFTDFSPGGLGLMPTMKRFELMGSFTSGLVAYDKSYLFTTIEAMRKIKNAPAGKVDGVHIHTDTPFEDIVALREFLPTSVGAVGWWEQNGNFFAALQLEKRALFVVLMLIILVASLNIVSSLLMTVMNRRREIALLLSMGASEKEIRRCFFLLGGTIGMGGVLLGIILGIAGIWLLGSFDIIALPADVYGTSRLPLELSWIDFSLITLGAVLIVLFSSWYPARRASKVDALSVLRHE